MTAAGPPSEAVRADLGLTLRLRLTACHLLPAARAARSWAAETGAVGACGHGLA
jgi:hypothetical protein